eukprot:2904234-Lingulodinium_polyedra.AAC.1
MGSPLDRSPPWRAPARSWRALHMMVGPSPGAFRTAATLHRASCHGDSAGGTWSCGITRLC